MARMASRAFASGFEFEGVPRVCAFLSLAASYLTEAKRSNGSPLDPVARFHLGNGALVHKVHSNADISDKGIAQSAGVMVNYLYDLDRVSQNHERFAAAQEVATSAEIRSQSAAAKKIAA